MALSSSPQPPRPTNPSTVTFPVPRNFAVFDGRILEHMETLLGLCDPCSNCTHTSLPSSLPSLMAFDRRMTGVASRSLAGRDSSVLTSSLPFCGLHTPPRPSTDP